MFNIVIKDVSNNVFNPIVSATQMVILGPEKVFADWLASSQYNEIIEVKKLSTKVVDCVSLSKQFIDKTFRLNVKKAREISGGFEEDSNINNPTHYMVDGHIVVSEIKTEKRTRGVVTPDEINIKPPEMGWNPSSRIEHEIQASVNQWMRQQMTLTGLVSLLEQLATLVIVPFAYDETKIKNWYLFACAVILQLSVLINTYRLYQLAEIEVKPISTLGHWAAEIRRYAYLFGSSYAQHPNVKKYLKKSEIKYLKGNHNEGQMLGPTDAVLPAIESLREQRIKHVALRNQAQNLNNNNNNN